MLPVVFGTDMIVIIFSFSVLQCLASSCVFKGHLVE